jgi:glycerophosphoryl diester phosphodiesterase
LIYIYLDFKNAAPAAAMREIRRVEPAMPLMVSLPASIKDSAGLNRFFAKVHPDALDGDYDGYTPEMLAAARRLGCPVIPDIQAPGEGPARWESVAGKDFNGLQSDHPGQLIAWLKERSLR